MSGKSGLQRIIKGSIYIFGVLLIIGGLTVLLWIVRPYIFLFVSSSEIEALETKVEEGKISANQIIIPSVLVDASILEGKGPKQLSDGVSHIKDSVTPEETGNCIIEGHNLAEFSLLRPKSFFSLLDVVRKDADVYVFWNGKKHAYKVEKKETKDVNDPALYEKTDDRRLTLITCVSTWSATIYTDKRTVVTAKPVD